MITGQPLLGGSAVVTSPIVTHVLAVSLRLSPLILHDSTTLQQAARQGAIPSLVVHRVQFIYTSLRPQHNDARHAQLRMQV